MALEHFEKLLRTQELDTRLAQIEHARSNHPIFSKIAELRTHSAEIAVGVQDEREERHKLDREQKRLDDDVAMIDAKRSDIEAKLYDGSVTGTKDLLAMQEESKNLAAHKAKVEDAELEIMEQAEAIQGVLDTAQASIDADTSKIEELQAELDGVLSDLTTEEAEVQAERVEVVAEVPEALLAAYHKLHANQDGIVVARLVGGACQACHMSLSAVTVDQIGKLEPEAVVHCDECGAILVR